MSVIEYDCEVCGKHVRKQWSDAQARVGRARYCSIKCKFAEAREYAAQRREYQNSMLSAEQIIERYYRSRAAGGRITLSKLAKEHGFSRTYLSKVKRKYDAVGKWGAPRK